VTKLPCRNPFVRKVFHEKWVRSFTLHGKSKLQAVTSNCLVITYHSVCVYIYKEPTWCNLAVCLLVTAIILYMFRTLCIHPQEHLKTVVTASGVWHATKSIILGPHKHVIVILHTLKIYHILTFQALSNKITPHIHYPHSLLQMAKHKISQCFVSCSLNIHRWWIANFVDLLTTVLFTIILA
jgi:hypothetical protein